MGQYGRPSLATAELLVIYLYLLRVDLSVITSRLSATLCSVMTFVTGDLLATYNTALCFYR